MHVVVFCHSLVSDWNHGNAHFLRGVISELLARDHLVSVYEPADAWSVVNLIEQHGAAAIDGFHAAYPSLRSTRYDPAALDLERALDGADLVVVHEWNEPALVARIGAHRARAGGYALLFHDTHHRAVSSPDDMSRYDLGDYDGVLAFGTVIRDLYMDRGWCSRAWTWHEAADTRVFGPRPGIRPARDLVWIGNWGDDERSRELRDFLIEPVRDLALAATVHGVRYPADALALLQDAGIDYRGWAPNYRAPQIFSQHRMTVHVPRRPYVEALPGIPTIRMFEALACGIPLISAPWSDAESLFTAGEDYLVAQDRSEMKGHMSALLNEPGLAASIAASGRETILRRHTCAHRVNELLAIAEQIRPAAVPLAAAHAPSRS